LKIIGKLLGELSDIQKQLIVAGVMFLASVFMTISYYVEIAQGDAERISHIAFYVWILSTAAWLVKLVHDVRDIRQTQREQRIVSSVYRGYHYCRIKARDYYR